MAIVIRILIFILLVSFHLSAEVHAETPLKAAFIRDHQLWVKEGNREIQLTKGQNVISPKWSKDGRFIAYLSINVNDETPFLYIYDLNKKESYQPYPSLQTTNFKWSPVSNQLAYNDDGVLNVTKTKNGRPQGFDNVSLGVSDFEWFPNGKEFVVSSVSQLLPSGWQPIHLFKVPVDANLDTKKIKPFYTIQTNTADLFAIDVEQFKWSADGKWISFLATPTASLSMDSNLLSVLSSKGEQFQVIGKMLNKNDWIKWAPVKNQLAFISGEGRFYVENKNTTIHDIPYPNKQKEYTPKGYVDLDLEWYTSQDMIVARAKENKLWKEGSVPTMFTALYLINIESGEQKQITFPKKNIEYDINPQVVRTMITWYRQTEKSNNGDVWMKDGINGSESIWLKNVDGAPVFYN